MLLFYPLPPPPLSMRAQFCRYLKLLNATIIRKVACVDGRTVMPRALSWPRRPRGIWLVPNIYAAQPLKNIRLSPANSASYAGYRKATRKGKKAKQRFEVKPGNLPRNLPSLLLDRKKQREISSSPRTSKDERKEEGMSYSPLGRNLWLCPLPTFVLPLKKLFQWNLFGHWSISNQWTTPFRRHKICRPGQMFTKSSFLVPLFTEHLPWSRGCLLNSWDRDTSSYNWRLGWPQVRSLLEMYLSQFFAHG